MPWRRKKKLFPKASFPFNVTKSVGGLEGTSAGGCLPRGRDQAAYLRSKQKSLVSDPFFSITQKIKSHEKNGEERFVHAYSNDDGSPKVVAYIRFRIQNSKL